MPFHFQTTGAALLLALVLFAYTLQTELASYVQHSLGYRKPYFLFYLTHSGYLLLAPLHLLALKLLGTPVLPALRDVLVVLKAKFSPPASFSDPPSSPRLRRQQSSDSARDFGEAAWTAPWVVELAKKGAFLTVAIAVPALSWYGAVPLTSMTDITAIYNVFAFWAYLLSLYFLPPSSARSSSLPSRLNPVDLVSVVLAVSGVFIIAYGDTGSPSSDKLGEEGSNRLLGNVLALVGSLSYAGYEVWYKLHIALPEPVADDQTTLRTLTSRSHSHLPLAGSSSREHLDDDGASSETSSLLSSPRRGPSRSTSPVRTPPPSTPPPDHALETSPTTFLLYTALLTSLIGLFTLLFLWVPIPLLHWAGWEAFEPPPRKTWGALVGIVGGGVVFNGFFQVLLALWGPTTASVANLLTLLLVALADQLFVPSAPPLTRSTLLGGACIVGAFGGLIWGEVRARRKGEEGDEEDDAGKRVAAV
ncbi:hypothetical protein JCM8097_003232 [Rhodosporidiobolus ruineniae]